MVLAAPDRRRALKARHRAAILSAARDLVAEREGPFFGVDDLADRADVARRTVFNHFAGLDDVLLSVCEETLAVLVDGFIATVAEEPVGDGSPASMFDELAAAVRATDLPTAILAVLRVLHTDGPAKARATDLTDAAFARVVDRLLAEVGRRNPSADPLDVELLITCLMHGIAVIARPWAEAGRHRTDPDAALADWSVLLERLLTRLRSGFAPA